MAVERSTVVTGIQFLAGLSIVALLVLTPPGAPDNRIKYEVAEETFDNPDRTTLAYANFTEAERAVFDAARETPGEAVNRTISTSPQSLTPPPGETVVYDVRADGATYAMQIRHYDNEVDFLTQQLPRVGLLGVGAVLIGLAAYRQFGR